jgi:hypothetical protein
MASRKRRFVSFFESTYISVFTCALRTLAPNASAGSAGVSVPEYDFRLLPMDPIIKDKARANARAFENAS